MPKLDLGGTTLHYAMTAAAGSGTSAPEAVVLLNGIAMSIGNWAPITEALVAGGRSVLCHDFRGQLLSARPPGPYSLLGHAEDLARLMDALGIEAAHVVGTSYGGEVALEFALAYPERTAGLVLIDSVCAADAILRAAVQGWKAAALADPVAFYRGIIAWNYSNAYIEANAENLAKREAAIAGLPRDWFLAFAALCDAFLAIDQAARIGAIRSPTLVAYGELDILKGARYSRDIAARIPGARLVEVAGSGHAVTIEKPQEVATLVAGFLEGIARSAAGRKE